MYVQYFFNDFTCKSLHHSMMPGCLENVYITGLLFVRSEVFLAVTVKQKLWSMLMLCI
jgi:hypothetical protein